MSVDPPPYPDLKLLRCFLAVCETRSITAAAIALGIGQATLSESIARLERRLGATLLVRGNRGVLLTQSGEILALQGRGLLDAAEALAQAVAEKGRDGGAVAVGLPPSLGVLIGILVAETVRSEFPTIRLRISEGLSGDLLDWLGEGRLDLGFVYEMPNMADFDAAPVFREELFLIAAPDFVPAAATEDPERTIPVSALGGLPFVLPSTKHNTRRILDRIFRTRRIVPEIAAEIDSHSQIVEMLVRASAYTVLPRSAVLRELSAGTLEAVPISGAAVVRTCYCVRQRQQSVSTASIQVQETIASIIREMSSRHALELEFLSGVGASG